MTDDKLISFTALGVGPTYEKIDIWAPLMMAEAMRRGERTIEGKTFTDCHFEGPAVVVPLEGCHFQACDFGWSDGDIRNLLLAPMGPKAIVGAIGFRNCTFTRCAFVHVGFSGSPDFLREMARTVVGANT